MANTVVDTKRLINVTFDGSTVWDYSTHPKLITSLIAILASSGDSMIVRDGSATGPILAKFIASANGQAIQLNYLIPSLRSLYVVGNQVSANAILIATY